MGAKTLYDQLWDEHVVRVDDNGTAVGWVERPWSNADDWHGRQRAVKPIDYRSIA